jgi:sugar lactone lactonase YvrE
MKHTRTEILIDGFSFVEGPRWHEGRLWFSDMIGQKVYTVDLKGNLKEIVEVPNRPSGLDFCRTALCLSLRCETIGCCVSTDMNSPATLI